MPKNRVLITKGAACRSVSYTSISPDKLSRLIGTAAAPALIDVCIGFFGRPAPDSRRDATKETHNWPNNKIR
jgi:hypothetical protein